MEELLYQLFKEEVLKKQPNWEMLHKYFLNYTDNSLGFLYKLYSQIQEGSVECFDAERQMSYQKNGNSWLIVFEGEAVQIEQQQLLVNIEQFIGVMERGVPIGSVVALKKAYLHQRLKEQMNEAVNMVVMQSWVPLEEAKVMIEYGGSVYPYGLSFGNKLLYFSPNLIETVEYIGYETEQSEIYEYEMKRLYIIEQGYKPFSLLRQSERDKLQEYVKGAIKG